MALMETLIDDYTTQNAAKWTYANSGAATAGQAIVPPNASYLPALVSVASYDLTASYASIQLVSVGTAEFYFTLSDSASATHTNCFRFAVSGGTLFDQILSGGTNVVNNPRTYSPVDHRWLRIRLVGANVLFDASPDGRTWVNLDTTAKVITATALFAHLMGGGTGASHIVDNFNLRTSIDVMERLTATMYRATLY